MDSLPPFSQIQPDQVQPAVTQAIADCKQKIEDVEFGGIEYNSYQ